MIFLAKSVSSSDTTKAYRSITPISSREYLSSKSSVTACFLASLWTYNSVLVSWTSYLLLPLPIVFLPRMLMLRREQIYFMRSATVICWSIATLIKIGFSLLACFVANSSAVSIKARLLPRLSGGNWLSSSSSGLKSLML